MEREYQKITLFNAVTPVAVTSSTDATPIVVTATAHGIKNGQRVLIQGHTTNLAANGIFIATAVSANAFTLTDEFTGASVAGSGAGAGSSGLCMVAPQIILTKDYRNIILQFGTSGSATVTVQVYGSVGRPDSQTVALSARKDMPNFGATVSPANQYGALQAIDLDTASAVNGATGFAASGSDILKLYEVNVNIVPYLTAFPTSWSGGAITLIAFVANNI